MQKAITLVHKDGLQIATHSIKSFRRNFSQSHRLRIHTDHSITEVDHHILLNAADGMDVKIVTAESRWEKLSAFLKNHPRLGELLNKRGSTLTKLEIPIFQNSPYFFFDSDVIWLRHVENLNPKGSPNAFSTESWSAYPGISNTGDWIKERVPRRVNSGFYYLGDPFPVERLDQLIRNKSFDKTIRYSGDQEIFAYLYRNLQYYHPADFMRTRVGSIYKLDSLDSAAVHFPGKMWMHHLEQIERLEEGEKKEPVQIRFKQARELSRFEILRMRTQLRMGDSTFLKPSLDLMRKLLRRFR